MRTIVNLIDADETVIERKITDFDWIRNFNVKLGSWLKVNGVAYRVEMISRRPHYPQLGEVNELHLKVLPN